MKTFLIRWFVNAAALLTVTHLFPGIIVEGWTAVAVAALVLGLLNAFIRPILLLVTLPVTVLTLGLFTFVVNAFLFYGTARVLEGFAVAGFADAFWGALVFSAVSFAMNLLIGTKR